MDTKKKKVQGRKKERQKEKKEDNSKRTVSLEGLRND